jgi:hypothetical protein
MSIVGFRECAFSLWRTGPPSVPVLRRVDALCVSLRAVLDHGLRLRLARGSIAIAEKVSSMPKQARTAASRPCQSGARRLCRLTRSKDRARMQDATIPGPRPQYGRVAQLSNINNILNKMH